MTPRAARQNNSPSFTEPNSQTLGNLSYTKALALLAVPAAETAKKRLAAVQSGETAQEESAKAAEQRAADAEAEAARLKKELKASGNQDVALFGVRFQDVQKDFHATIEALGRVGAGGDAGQHDKLVDALRALMSALEQSIPEKLETA